VFERGRERTDDLSVAGLAVSDSEVAKRKAWLEFTEEDVTRLREMNALAIGYADEVIGAFYDHLLAFDETATFFRQPGVLERVKRAQRRSFLRLTEGSYDREYVEDRLRIGVVHERIGLDVSWYLGGYNFYLRSVAQRLFDEYPDDPEKALAYYLSLEKLVFLDIGLGFDTYIHQRERTIRFQQEAIQELSTPVLQVRDRLLILPIIGAIDTMRARQLTEQLLKSIRSARAKVVVMDITGVPIVDTSVANHLVQTVEAARLMGATTIVTGLSAEIAQTLVTLGVDLRQLRTAGDLQGGIEEAERLLGYKVTQSAEGTLDNDYVGRS
jgi:rsbT co-antagonist protein RsbR